MTSAFDYDPRPHRQRPIDLDAMPINTPAQLAGVQAEAIDSYPMVSSRILAKSIVAQARNPSDLLVALIKAAIDQERKWHAMSTGALRPTGTIDLSTSQGGQHDRHPTPALAVHARSRQAQRRH